MVHSSYVIDEMNFDGNKEKDHSVKRQHTFEETVSELGTGIFHIFILLVCGSSVLSSVNEGLSIGFVLPYVKCDLQMTSAEQGMLNSSGFIGVILSSHFWGFMADTWGRKKVMQLSVFTAFILSASSSFANNVWLMILLRFAVGLCVSGVQSSGIAYLGEFHSNKTRSKYVTFTAMFSTLSIVYMAVIGWLVIPAEWQTTLFGMVYKPWRLFILTSSGINIFAFLGLLFMPESPKFLLAMGKKEEALAIIKKVYKTNTGKSMESFPVTEIELEKLGSNLADAKGFCAVLKMMWNQTKPLFMKPLAWNLAKMSYLSFCLFGIAHGFYMWYPEILSIYYKNSAEPVTICRAIALSTFTNITNIESTEIEANAECVVTNSSTTYPIFVIMGTTFAVLYIFVAMCMQNIGRRLLICSWMVVSCVSSIGVVFTKEFYVMQAFVILVCSSGNCGSILTAISADLFPTRYKGMALCIIMISARFGAIVGNNVVAAILFNSCDHIFYIYVTMLATSILVFCTVPTKPNSHE